MKIPTNLTMRKRIHQAQYSESRWWNRCNLQVRHLKVFRPVRIPAFWHRYQIFPNHQHHMHQRLNHLHQGLQQHSQRCFQMVKGLTTSLGRLVRFPQQHIGEMSHISIEGAAFRIDTGFWKEIRTVLLLNHLIKWPLLPLWRQRPFAFYE